MIARFWTGYAALADANAYPRHLLQTVRPKLAGIAGFGGLYLFARRGGEVEYQVLTLWESMDALRVFAGPDPHRAVIEPAAMAALIRFDADVRHYDVLASPGEWSTDG